MRVLAHSDPWLLEGDLLRRVSEAHPPGSLGPTLIVVPTVRLAEHLQRRLAEVRPAWLGLEVLHFRTLALRILEETGRPLPHVASTRLLEAILREELRDRSDNLWARFVERRPGAGRRLWRTLNDLREAGIRPADLKRHSGDGRRRRDLADLFRRYCAVLEDRRKDGWVDDAGLIAEAVREAPAFGRRRKAVFLHGAYELTGVHLDLVRRLDRTSDLSVMLPATPGAPGSIYATEFAERYLLSDGDRLEGIDAAGSGSGLALDALYDEERFPAPGAPGRFAFRHMQGEAAEVRVAVLDALQAIREGCPPTEIAIVARSLEPYAPAIEEAFEDPALPWTSSLAGPLRRHPAVRDFVLLLQVVGEDFPRRATAELLRSPRIRWKALSADAEAARRDRAEVWSRKAKIIGGLDEWTEELPLWAARPTFYRGQGEDERSEAERRAQDRVAQARRVASALAALHERVTPTARTWSEHARKLADLQSLIFVRAGDTTARAALEGLSGLIDEMGRMETIVRDTRPIPFSKMRVWLEEALDGSELVLQALDNGGIRVLDAMQARGLTFRRVFLLGLNTGLFPRSPREDPILTDDWRETLRERTGRPLTIQSKARSEERLLLCSVLGSASDKIEVSWQRADESGKAKSLSLGLREIARIARGRPDLDALRREARHIPSHPTHWLEALVEEPGLISRQDRALLAALHAGRPRAFESLAAEFPELASGLEMLEATQSFTPEDLRYDARIGPLESGEELSVTALDTLGRCPLQFFFARVLRVNELEEAPDLFHLSPRDMGTQVHELLQVIYEELAGDGKFDADDGEELVRSGLALLDRRRSEIMGELDRRLERRLPVLWSRLSENWFTSLRAFVESDLRRLHAEGLKPEGLEELLAGDVAFGKNVVQRIRGRFDRRLRGPEGLSIGDYKTGGSLDRLTNPTYMLKGNALQVPLYRMLAGGDATVELLGVGPRHDPAGGDPVRSFSGFDKKEQEASFLDTMRVLLQLRWSGTFPWHKDIHCDWCAYAQACRRTHPPTADREDKAKDNEAYRHLRRKSASKPDGR